MKKENRKRKIKLRKNVLPAFLVTVVLWGLIFLIIYFVEPETVGAIPLFLLILFLALVFTFSFAFAHARRGFLASMALITFLILRYLGIGNFLNFVLILGLVATIELYFSNK